MNIKSKALVTGHAPIEDHSVNQVSSDKGGEFKSLKAANDERIHEAPVKERSPAKTVLMFFAAPFIALAYVIAAPFVGIVLIAKLALEAFAKRSPAVNGKLKNAATLGRNIGLFFASPFIALAYAIALPFFGLFMLSKLAIEAYSHTR